MIVDPITHATMGDLDNLTRWEGNGEGQTHSGNSRRGPQASGVPLAYSDGSTQVSGSRSLSSSWSMNAAPYFRCHEAA